MIWNTQHFSQNLLAIIVGKDKTGIDHVRLI